MQRQSLTSQSPLDNDTEKGAELKTSVTHFDWSASQSVKARQWMRQNGVWHVLVLGLWQRSLLEGDAGAGREGPARLRQQAAELQQKGAQRRRSPEAEPARTGTRHPPSSVSGGYYVSLPEFGGGVRVGWGCRRSCCQSSRASWTLSKRILYIIVRTCFSPDQHQAGLTLSQSSGKKVHYHRGSET